MPDEKSQEAYKSLHSDWERASTEAALARDASAADPDDNEKRHNSNIKDAEAEGAWHSLLAYVARITSSGRKSGSANSPTGEQSCKRCGSRLHAGATLCHVCQRYQSPVPYGLQSISNFGVLALAAALVPWAINQGIEFKDRHSRPSLKIVSFGYPGETILLNDGRKEVYVLDLFVQAPGIGNDSATLGFSIQASKFATTDEVLGIANQVPSGWRAVWAPGNEFELGLHFMNRSCIRTVFRSASHRLQLQLRNAHRDLGEWPGSAEIRFSGSEGSIKSETIDVVAVAYANPECRDELADQGLGHLWKGRSASEEE